MRFAAVLLQTLLAAYFFLVVDAKCDEEIVKKIKSLNVDSTNIIEKLNGEYALVYIETSQLDNVNYAGHCFKIKFSDDGKTKKIQYENMMEGTLENKGGTLTHKGTEYEPEFTYYPIINTEDMFATYMCTTDDDDYEGEEDEDGTYDLSYIAVPVTRSLEGLTEQVEAVSKTMMTLGLPRGQTTLKCFYGAAELDSDDEPVRRLGSCTIEERSYHEIQCR